MAWYSLKSLQFHGIWSQWHKRTWNPSKSLARYQWTNHPIKLSIYLDAVNQVKLSNQWTNNQTIDLSRRCQLCQTIKSINQSNYRPISTLQTRPNNQINEPINQSRYWPKTTLKTGQVIKSINYRSICTLRARPRNQAIRSKRIKGSKECYLLGQNTTSCTNRIILKKRYLLIAFF